MNILKTVLLGSVVFASSSAMALDYPVIDSTAAIMSSNLYRKAVSDFDAQIKPKKDKIESVKKELEDMNTRFMRDGKIMADKDKQALQNQAQGKLNEYNSIAEGLQKQMAEAEGSLQKDLQPKLQSVIEALAKENGYKGFIEKRSMIWVDPSVDITKTITERLNALK